MKGKRNLMSIGNITYTKNNKNKEEEEEEEKEVLNFPLEYTELNYDQQNIEETPNHELREKNQI